MSLIPELPPELVSLGGMPFGDELAQLAEQLDQLSNPDRARYRGLNATCVAEHPAARILIVAGPGSGKSFLFLARIKHWLECYPDETIYVSSFVRKLVKDLRSEIEQRAGLADKDKERVTVTILNDLQLAGRENIVIIDARSDNKPSASRA